MNRFILRQSLLLFVAALIWGSAFVAQSIGADYVQPFTFGAARNVIGTLVLLPYIALADRFRKQKADDGRDLSWKNPHLLKAGISCGALLCIASTLQQLGIGYTSVGKAGFITALYIVLVPIVGIFLKRKVGGQVWIAVVIAVVGLYLLCLKEGSMEVGFGDLMVLCCALGFSFQIMTVDHFAPLVDGAKLACLQFASCAVFSAVLMLIFEQPTMENMVLSWKAIAYVGVFSSGIAYTLQVIGQRGMNPTVASLIMSLESVISAICGFLFLGQAMSSREVLGSVLMFAAIICAQMPAIGSRNKADEKRKTAVSKG